MVNETDNNSDQVSDSTIMNAKMLQLMGAMINKLSFNVVTDVAKYTKKFDGEISSVEAKD